MPRRRRRWPWLLATLVLLLIAGLLHTGWPFMAYPVTELQISRPAPLPAERIQVPVAGVAEVDITPPIGIPKFGYSAWARPADGFRTRLRARAFYLHAPDSTPLALVTLDLGAGSRVLHSRVAELIAARTDVPAHGLSLLATHTHSGPGQYLDSDFYNVFGSDSPGFDPQLAEFLSQQIADAVIQAFEGRRAARVATGQSEVRGFTRNRSLAAWARNPGAQDRDDDGADALRAINPRLTMLRIDLEADDGRYYPAGALTSFSIHGTAIPAFTRPWHADVWAWLGRDVALGIAADHETPFVPVHGAYQATHGDNSPAWVRGQRGDREARRIGEGLAGHALQLFNRLGDQLDDTLRTAVASRELDLLALPEAERHGLCSRAIVGAATAGAAEGDEVFPISWLPYLQHGWPRRVFTDGCHSEKQWMLSGLQRLLPASRFPHRPLLQIVQVNDMVLVALPWEVTLESGNRLREAVTAELPRGAWQVEISSVANGYVGYATTPEEYSLQYYEGGHTLYGPGTLAFLTAASQQLARDLVTHGDIDEVGGPWHYRLRSRDYWPQTDLPVASRSVAAPPVFVPADGPGEAHWRFRFHGEHPAHLDLTQPLLSIEADHGNGWQPFYRHDVREDDQGSQLRLRWLDNTATGADYAVHWYDPPAPSPAVRFRIRIEGEPVLFSPAF